MVKQLLQGLKGLQKAITRLAADGTMHVELTLSSCSVQRCSSSLVTNSSIGSLCTSLVTCSNLSFLHAACNLSPKKTRSSGQHLAAADRHHGKGEVSARDAPMDCSPAGTIPQTILHAL